MRRKLLFLISLLFIASPLYAHPPLVIELDYIKEEGTLYVFMDHLSRDHRKHYIRKTDILVNGADVASQANRQQIDPNHYAFSMPLEAKEKDEITVKAYCAEGGTASATFIVPKEETADEKDKRSGVKTKVQSYKNPDPSNEVYGSQEGVYEDTSEVYK